MDINLSKVEDLKKFLENIERDFTILDHPDLGFFRDFLDRLGAKIPDHSAPTGTIDCTQTKDASVVPEEGTGPLNDGGDDDRGPNFPEVAGVNDGDEEIQNDSSVVRQQGTSAATNLGLTGARARSRNKSAAMSRVRKEVDKKNEIPETSDVLLGWETHGYKRPGDLMSDQVKSAAERGWLTKEQYLAILFNTKYYSDLIIEEPPYSGEPSSEWMGRIFLCDRNKAFDDEEWLTEKIVMVPFKGVVFMLCSVSCTVLFERRGYVTSSRTDHCIYHYYKNTDLEQKDRAKTTTAMDRVKSALGVARPASPRK